MSLVKLNLKELLKEPFQPPSEAELKRREEDAQRCKERCSSVPFYQRQAARMGDEFWKILSKNYANRK